MSLFATRKKKMRMEKLPGYVTAMSVVMPTACCEIKYVNLAWSAYNRGYFRTSNIEIADRIDKSLNARYKSFSDGCILRSSKKNKKVKLYL